MPVQSIDLKTNNYSNVRALLAAGNCDSITDGVNKALEGMFTNNYQITINGVTKNVKDFMATTPYLKKDFTELGASGDFVKKFVINFNHIPADTLKIATFNFIKACIEFIQRKYSKESNVGTVENISIYYPNVINDGYLHAVYIDVKNATETISISRFIQLKLKNRFVGPNNLLWDEIQNFLCDKGYNIKNIYKLSEEDLVTLTIHLNQA